MDETPTSPIETCDERGMTLIELMVVVLIIGILMAVAFPTYANQTEKAQDRGAESALHDGMVAAGTVFTDGQTYEGVTPAVLHAEEPALAFVDSTAAASAKAREVSVRTGGTGADAWVLLVTGSGSGRCYASLHQAEESTRYQVVDAPTCAAADFDPSAGTWTTSW